VGAGCSEPTAHRPAKPGDPTVALADLLVASIEALAGAGEVEAACRQAGQACAVLRRTDPGQWRKFNALLHRLSRRVR
jgi:hypothetical protein